MIRITLPAKQGSQAGAHHLLLQDPHGSAIRFKARLLSHLRLLKAPTHLQILRDVKHFIKDSRGEAGAAEASAPEPMARLLVQVELPQKGLQPPALPPAVKQQASSPRAAVAVSHLPHKDSRCHPGWSLSSDNVHAEQRRLRREYSAAWAAMMQGHS